MLEDNTSTVGGCLPMNHIVALVQRLDIQVKLYCRAESLLSAHIAFIHNKSLFMLKNTILHVLVWNT